MHEKALCWALNACTPILAVILSAGWWLAHCFYLVGEEPQPSHRAAGARRAGEASVV